MKILLFSLLIILNTAMANDDVARAKKIDLILDLSGLQKQTLSLNDMVKEQVGAKLENEPNSDKKQIGKILIEEFKAQDILAGIKKELSQNFTNDEINTLATILSDEGHKKFNRAEEETSDPANLPSIQEYFRTHQNPPESRLALFEKFDRVLGTTKISVLIVVATMKSMVYAVTNKKFSEEELSAFIKQLLPVMRESQKVSFVYTYREFNDAELEKYLGHYTSPAMQKLNKAAIAQYEKGFSDWGERAGKRIRVLVEAKKKK